MELKGSKTEANLMAAFAGESQARNKYTYYASKAKKDGYEQIAAIFDETANNEKEHAKMWFKELHGGSIPSTEVNLLDAANGENWAARSCTDICGCTWETGCESPMMSPYFASLSVFSITDSLLAPPLSSMPADLLIPVDRRGSLL